MGTGRAAPATARPAKAVTRAPCRGAGGSPDFTARRRRAARGRSAFSIRGGRRVGTRTTAIERALTRLIGTARTGIRRTLALVERARARAKEAGEGAKSRRPGTASTLNTANPGRRISAGSRGAEMSALPKGSAFRSRATGSVKGVCSGSRGRSSAAHDGAGASSPAPARRSSSPRTHGAAGWFK